jgi:metal-dependent amidase/aminoacylase/carboxypeptidase family protein
MKTTPCVKQAVLPRGKRSYCLAVALLVFCILPVFGYNLGQLKGQDETAIETRLKQTVGYLASDELQGRGPGTEGIDRAAEYIVKRMQKIGLKTDLFNGSPYQTFNGRVMHFGGGNRDSRSSMWSYIGNRIYDAFLKNNASPRKNQASKIPPTAPEGLVKMKNVVAMLAGQGPLAEETIVIGAHYDHLGVRKTPNGDTVVYNGANDNASGVAVMLEAAELLARREKKLPRRIVFIAFSGEESGLLGSFYYVSHPLVPLEKTIAMINLDVVGRMEGDILITIGTSTSPALAKLTDKFAKQNQLNLMELPKVFAGSDHVPFYSHRIPVVFFLTQGGRSDYHRPSDDAEKLNYPGMRKIAQTTADLSVTLAEADRRPQFAEEGIISILFRNLLRLWGWLFDVRQK